MWFVAPSVARFDDDAPIKTAKVSPGLGFTGAFIPQNLKFQKPRISELLASGLDCTRTVVSIHNYAPENPSGQVPVTTKVRVVNYSALLRDGQASP